MDEETHEVTAEDSGIIDGCLTFWNRKPDHEPESYEEIESGAEPEGTLIRAFAAGLWMDVSIVDGDQ